MDDLPPLPLQVATESKVATTPVTKPKRGRKSAAPKTVSTAPSPPESTVSRGGDMDMEVDAGEAERAAEAEGVCRGSPYTTSRQNVLTSSGHSRSQAAHQLAAETLLSIGPNSRSSAARDPVERPLSAASTSRAGDDSASSAVDARGLKRKSLEDAVAQKARTNGLDSLKRRALSPGRPGQARDGPLPTRGYRGPRPRPYSFYGSDEEYEFAQLSTEEQQHRRLLDWHHMRSQQQKDEDEMIKQHDREYYKAHHERFEREWEQRERERRLGATGLTNGTIERDVANGTRPEAKSAISDAAHASAPAGARSALYRYGGSMFDPDRYGYGRPADRNKDTTSSILSSTRPASWVNPLVASRSRPGSPGGSAQSKASPTMNALTRKELQDHRDSLLEGKKWLEERLSKTEKLLGQLNEKLVEPAATVSMAAGRPGSAHGPASAVSAPGTPAKEDEAMRARQAREKELANSRRTGYGMGFGGGGLLGGSGSGGYGSPYGGGLGLLRMSEWDSWSREKHLRERERENREKEAERLRLETNDKADREKPNGSTASTSAAGTGAASASPSALERKPIVPPLGSSLGLSRRKEMGGLYGGHGGSWSMT